MKCLWCQLERQQENDTNARTRSQHKYWRDISLRTYTRIITLTRILPRHYCGEEHQKYIQILRKSSFKLDRMKERKRMFMLMQAIENKQQWQSKLEELKRTVAHDNPARHRAHEELAHAKHVLSQRIRRMREAQPQNKQNKELLRRSLENDFNEMRGRA